MNPTPPERIGDRLIAQGLLKEPQLAAALNEQRRAYRPLGEILVGLGFVSQEDLAEILAVDLDIPFLRAHEFDPDPALTAAFDRSFVHETSAFPVALEEGVLQVVMVHPDDPQRVEAIRSRCPYPLRLAVTTHGELHALMRLHLPENDGRLERLLRQAGTGLEPASQDGSEALDDYPIERLTEAVLIDGVQRRASDIHIEPEEHVTRLRYRLDGVLRPGENLPRAATDAVISRIKILSGLDISERRRPQDGRLRLELDGRTVDMRVSILPCSSGENVVLRILGQGQGLLGLEALGFSAARQSVLDRIAQRPHGLFLVTGPTGSGKTTTLYSMLARIDAMQRNVCTIEDPVEYHLPLVRQSQVDPSIEYTFDAGLRSLLRQDPDVVLVGEIRDSETAEMAMRASMTGHLVLSTLHTNSALGAIPRLLDLGVDPFLVEDALIGVLAQRLVRKVCDSCSREREPTQVERAWLGELTGQVRSGRGCEHCGGSGYSGRVAVSELLLPDDAMAGILRRGAELHRLADLAAAAGFETVEDDGRRLVSAGISTMDEVQRVHRSHRLSGSERGSV